MLRIITKVMGFGSVTRRQVVQLHAGHVTPVNLRCEETHLIGAQAKTVVVC